MNITYIIEKISKHLQYISETIIVPKFRNISQSFIEIKSSSIDIVTEVDYVVENYLASIIKKFIPEASIIGEEAASKNPDILQNIATSEYSVTIDPIDGTWNYVSGVPMFGIIVSIINQGITIAGIIYDPLCGDYVFAIRDEGAYIKFKNGGIKRLHVTKSIALDELIGFSALHLCSKEIRNKLAVTFSGFKVNNSLRCVAHEYRIISSGHAHFMLSARLKPWDHAAGQLIHTEAGGYSALLDYRHYSPKLHKGQLLLAPNKDIWEHIRSKIDCI